MFGRGKRRVTRALKKEISRAQRFGYYIGILLVDVAADTPRGVHKHLPGITINVRHFMSLLRDYDIVVKTRLRRYSVILPHLNERESVHLVKDRLRFTSFLQDWGSINIGVALYPTHGKTARDLIKAAEADLAEFIEKAQSDDQDKGAK